MVFFLLYCLSEGILSNLRLKGFFSGELLFNDNFTNLKKQGYVEVKFNIVNLTAKGLAHLEVLEYCYIKMIYPPEYFVYPQEKILWLLCNNPYCKWANFKRLSGLSGRVLQSMAENFKSNNYIKKVKLHGTNVYQLTKRGKRIFSKYLNTVKIEGYWIKQDEIERYITDIQDHIEQFIFGPFESYCSSDSLKFKETLKYIKKAQKTFKKVEKRLNKLKRGLFQISTLRKGKTYKNIRYEGLSAFLE